MDAANLGVFLVITTAVRDILDVFIGTPSLRFAHLTRDDNLVPLSCTIL